MNKLNKYWHPPECVFPPTVPVVNVESSLLAVALVDGGISKVTFKLVAAGVVVACSSSAFISNVLLAVSSGGVPIPADPGAVRYASFEVFASSSEGRTGSFKCCLPVAA